jgi:hypothetical protein
VVVRASHCTAENGLLTGPCAGCCIQYPAEMGSIVAKSWAPLVLRVVPVWVELVCHGVSLWCFRPVVVESIALLSLKVLRLSLVAGCRGLLNPPASYMLATDSDFGTASPAGGSSCTVVFTTLLMPNQLGRTQYSLPRFVIMPWPGWPCWRIGGKVLLTVAE